MLKLQKPTFTKSGDIWALGRHRLICGDSTKEETYTALMNGRKANLVITDPPYNVNYEGSAGKIQNDNMASEKFSTSSLMPFPIWRRSWRTMRPFMCSTPTLRG